MKRVSGVLLFFSLNVFSVQAQKIFDLSGIVRDLRSAPLVRASVYLLNTNNGAITDENGLFVIKNIREGRYLMQVSAIGYATTELNITVTGSAENHISVTLHGEVKQLDAALVTAQKTEEFLQQIPFSITSLSSRQVQQYRLWNSNELTAIVPNLFSSNSGDERNVTSIRGITTTSYDPAVATYIDGISQFSLDTYIAQLFDVERIEILRGPQGTLYGRNAMGGVINIITKQPAINSQKIFAEINVGNYGQQRYMAGFRVPLVKNKLMFGVVGMFNKRHGFYKNQFNNSDFDALHSFTGNYYLKYFMDTKWVFTFNFKHVENRNNGAFPLVNGIDEALSNPYLLSQNAVGTMIDNTVNSSLSINFKGRYFNFNSQTSYQSNRRYYNRPLDGDFSPIDGVTIINDYGGNWNKVKVISQEFKFTSPGATNSSLKWVAGSYLFHQNSPNKQAVHFGKDAAMLGAPDIDFSTINTTKGKSSGIAIFGQATYNITHKLDIIAGIRYDYENKKYNVLGEYQKDPDPNPIFETRPDTSAEASFSAFSPKVSLAYKINNYSNAFAVYSRGFRTGGLTQLSTDPSQPPLYVYKPEHSNNIEIGIKNNFLKNRLQLNATGFITKVSDAQVPTLILPDAITVTRNAGVLESKGVELEIYAKPINGLQAIFNFGYTNAKYKNLKLSQYGSAINLDGKRQIFTPEMTSMLAVQYDFDINSKKKVKGLVRGEWAYLGKQYFDLANSISQPGYSLLNCRLGITFKNVEVMFWDLNLTNKKCIAYAYDFGAIHLGNPKTHGVALNISLGK